MSNVRSITEARTKAESEETKVDEMFADIIERNKRLKEQQEKERAARNKNVIASTKGKRK